MNCETTTNDLPAPEVLSRIYVDEVGDIVVTDLWEELQTLLVEKGDFCEN